MYRKSKNGETGMDGMKKEGGREKKKKNIRRK